MSLYVGLLRKYAVTEVWTLRFRTYWILSAADSKMPAVLCDSKSCLHSGRSSG